MNTKGYLIASLAAGIWILIYGFVANTIVLADFWASHTVSPVKHAKETSFRSNFLSSTHMMLYPPMCIVAIVLAMVSFI